MISEDISNGEELVEVPVVNELSDERPTPFGVTVNFIVTYFRGCEIVYNFK